MDMDVNKRHLVGVDMYHVGLVSISFPVRSGVWERDYYIMSAHNHRPLPYAFIGSRTYDLVCDGETVQTCSVLELAYLEG